MLNYSRMSIGEEMVNIAIIRRGFYIMQTQGVLTALRKTIIYFWAKIIGLIGRILFQANSKKYWNFRMKYDWNFVGGGDQTLYLSAGALANIDLHKLKDIRSVLDFGCATGDSSILLKIFFPEVKIYLHDLSEVGVEKALIKYSRFLPVHKYTKGTTADFVYNSNVIEHVPNPKDLVNELIECSSKYILIQCPWKEMHPINGKLITPDNQSDEHTWTIDETFFEKYIKDSRVNWTLTTGIVPMAWEGGVQAFYFGEKTSQ